MEKPCWTWNHATDGIGSAQPQLRGFATPLASAHAAAHNDLPDGQLPDGRGFPTTVFAPGARCIDLVITTRSGRRTEPIPQPHSHRSERTTAGIGGVREFGTPIRGEMFEEKIHRLDGICRPDGLGDLGGGVRRGGQ